MRSRTKLKGKKIYIGYDLTKMQAEAESIIKAELGQRISNGETDLQIRYQHGLPKIVQKN